MLTVSMVETYDGGHACRVAFEAAIAIARRSVAGTSIISEVAWPQCGLEVVG